MKLTGNTVFVTGGGSGIGRGLAEALHKLGNQVIISGRRPERLQATIDANPGMHAVSLDIADPTDIKKVAEQLIADHSSLNVLINNAGIMLLDDAAGPVDDDLLSSTVATNLLGTIRMTSALIEHLKTKDGAVVANVSSVLGFVPMATSAVYSATKAALHSYTLSQRYLLRGSKVSVIEIVPPWVRTELLNSTEEPRAMPLDAFIAGTIEQLGADANEILVGPAVAMRANPGPNEHAWVNEFNDTLAAG
ncbi:SDR family NAD(P)-dependent oxidoreductase [Cupriavidus basilensis]|uniref:SDR family NAD(P)-dependent oxidoreductase n=1 Tax=Cupriavidus basilensis TaxID=68895 RepID=A0ABT6B1N3_9BURK|nr:SDR family NAD(P)-dependent oxidoreductase [Cupriavidus basilensis]MDF3838799.1 SDR family NAD(P)-dependent oxidoreductase [Cupriavidus basilensis]